MVLHGRNNVATPLLGEIAKYCSETACCKVTLIFGECPGLMSKNKNKNTKALTQSRLLNQPVTDKSEIGYLF